MTLNFNYIECDYYIIFYIYFTLYTYIYINYNQNYNQNYILKLKFYFSIIN